MLLYIFIALFNFQLLEIKHNNGSKCFLNDRKFSSGVKIVLYESKHILHLLLTLVKQELELLFA